MRGRAITRSCQNRSAPGLLRTPATARDASCGPPSTTAPLARPLIRAVARPRAARPPAVDARRAALAPPRRCKLC